MEAGASGALTVGRNLLGSNEGAGNHIQRPALAGSGVAASCRGIGSICWSWFLVMGLW
jgi:hypothetical protein